jgi:hypothetical protein
MIHKINAAIAGYGYERCPRLSAERKRIVRIEIHPAGKLANTETRHSQTPAA